MHRLNCNVQKYGWGRKGKESKVALFKQSQSPDYVINDTETYAELWMGTHSNCPSQIQENSLLLSDYIKSDPSKILGEKITQRFYSNSNILKPGDLPFLFKVLSINQALSIQAHPNQTLAAQLNKSDPKNYPDSNHKPEMLISISEKFDALCGFRPVEEIIENFDLYPELVNLCNEENCENFRKLKSESQLKLCFSSLMNKNDSIISQQLDNLSKRINNSLKRTELENLFLNLIKQYPGDVGCFSIFLLNYINLKKGEAIFLSANVPHAYLYGDGVECMACSDNVVRAGLTPKFKDVKVLCEMLDYSMKSSEENKLKGERVNDFIVNFRPSVDEFSVQEIKVEAGNYTSIDLPCVESGSIVIVIEADEGLYFQCDDTKLKVKQGCVYFTDFNKQISIVHESGTGSMTAFRAFCEIKN